VPKLEFLLSFILDDFFAKNSWQYGQTLGPNFCQIMGFLVACSAEIVVYDLACSLLLVDILAE
jgi:uncharacterized membrane protein